MSTVLLNPLADARWTTFVQSHPAASVFHSSGWLEALRRTYGYPCLAYALDSGRDIVGGVVFCLVRSWLTGTRLVSLPFADHCEPLVDSIDDFNVLMQAATLDVHRKGAKFAEIRPASLDGGNSGLVRSGSYCFHVLDLTAPTSRIFGGFHKDCVQRKIRRAERENLRYDCGTGAELIEKFYSLMILTRRRHQLPPQPLGWFRNLVDCMQGGARIHLASTRDGQPVASIFTLQHGSSLVYKYGCSDAQLSAKGGTPLLFWRAIEEAKASGLTSFDMGRSDLDNEGLITFKDRLGATKTTLTYWRSSGVARNGVRQRPGLKMARMVFALMPDWLLTATGSLLYKHAG